jgi:dTDP-4-dehydrorhamnose reductase
VFGGRLARPYVESDSTAPLNVYGLSKAEAERRILAMGGQALVVRTAAFFSPDDSYNFAAMVIRALGGGRALPAADDRIITPTYVPHLCQAVLDLMIDGETGLWHLSNGEAQFGVLIADAAGLDSRMVRPVPADELGWIAERPRQAALHSQRGQRLPSLSKAMEHYGVAIAESAILTGVRPEQTDPTEVDCVA